MLLICILILLSLSVGSAASSRIAHPEETLHLTAGWGDM